MSRRMVGIAAIAAVAWVVGCADECSEQAEASCKAIEPEQLGESWETCLEEARIRCEAGEQL